MARGSWYESALPVDALTAGYAVVVPDFEGIGVPGDSTYLTGRSAGHAVLDGLRAAQRLPGAGVSPMRRWWCGGIRKAATPPPGPVNCGPATALS